jgi:septal ring factor EnvC (AmiA/AmiB activator)
MNMERFTDGKLYLRYTKREKRILWITLLAFMAVVVIAFSALAQQKTDPPKATASADAVSKDTVIQIAKLQRDEALLQSQYQHDQSDMQNLQQQYQQKNQEILSLKLQIEASQHGACDFDLNSLTCKPPAKPAAKAAPEKPTPKS